MLEKDPVKRITIKEAINHPWMQSFRNPTLGQGTDEFEDLNDELMETDSNVVSNMKKFMEGKFDVNNIKPQDIVMKTPLIRGKLDSIQTDSIFSPGGSGVATPAVEIHHKIQQRQNDILTKAAGLSMYLKGGKKEKEEQKVSIEQFAQKGQFYKDNCYILLQKAQAGKAQNRLKQLEGQIKQNKEEEKKEQVYAANIKNKLKKLDI